MIVSPIRQMALENSTWGRKRIANELLLKLSLMVSPRTLRKYMPKHCVGGPGKRRQTQSWSTFIRNHAKGTVACDFCIAVTATFRMLDDTSLTRLRNNEVVLVASGQQLPKTNQMIREQIGEEWYGYVPLGKFVVSAPGVCQGRSTFPSLLRAARRPTFVTIEVCLDRSLGRVDAACG